MTGLEVVILGSGSSGGVPRGDGDWGWCDPNDPRNRRSRCSMLARLYGPNGVTSVVIDTSPDLRAQAIAAGITHVDGVLYTHDHADQVHGIDDLRVFAIQQRRRIPAWMDAATQRSLHHRFDYIFESHGGYPAIVEGHLIPPHGRVWSVPGPGGDLPVTTFDQQHGLIRSVGYRLGDERTGVVVYSSDVSGLDDAALDAVRGADLWILDALRYTRHPSHAHLDQALYWIARSGVRRAVLTNLHIDMDFGRLTQLLPPGVEVAYDNWRSHISHNIS